MDILAATKTQGKNIITSFWILVIETENSSVNASEGLPQLLSYAFTSLEQQNSVWGLTTNGMDYQFVFIQQGVPTIYQLLPKLDISRPESAVELLQVLKSINRQYFDLPN
jgi:hypothetical protein